MRTLALLPLLAALPLCAASAAAWATCPTLPADAGLAWERIEGPGFVFCKAIRDDGQQAFAVRISADAAFKPRRAQRAEASVIDGQEVHWYSRQDPFQPQAVIRETLVEIDDDRIAHVILRASSEAELAQIRRTAEGMRFADARVGSQSPRPSP